jgi:hypothetical protein
MDGPPDPSLLHLFGRLAVVEERVRVAVTARRTGDPNPDDPFRGLYLSHAQAREILGRTPGRSGAHPEADELLINIEREADGTTSNGEEPRLRRLIRVFGLEPLDVELFLVALAPDLDRRFERLYGYLNDDVSRRRASVGLALELGGGSPLVAAARRRLMPGSPLIEGGLLIVEQPERPFLSRPLRVPDRVTAHLLGDDSPDPSLARLLMAWSGQSAAPSELAAALAAGPQICYVRERPGTSGRAIAVAALRAAGRTCVVIDLARLGPADDAVTLSAAAVREARLTDSALVAGPVEAFMEHGAAAIRSLTEAAWPVVLVGRSRWDPSWSRNAPLMVDAPILNAQQRGATWRMHLDGDAPEDVDIATVTSHFRMSDEQVSLAVASARAQRPITGGAITVSNLLAGARAQNAAGLERLARRIEPAAGWEDLIVPPDVLSRLQELIARTRHNQRVFLDWSAGGRSPRQRGVTALFSGPSGVGKTMASEVVGHELGLDLYTIDLATVVSKYIGETEKNLERIFAEAEGVNGILLFDEADALFGKRSEVKDAHDRYANLEIAYLLQRMETFDGIAILASNMRSSLDESFARRLDIVVDFPLPDEADRHRLWARFLGSNLPTTADVDRGFLASAFSVSGGNIRNIVVAAAFLAAEEAGAVSMEHLIRATQREYQKLGRLCPESEFGPYYRFIEAN